MRHGKDACYGREVVGAVLAGGIAVVEDLDEVDCPGVRGRRGRVEVEDLGRGLVECFG